MLVRFPRASVPLEKPARRPAPVSEPRTLFAVGR